MSRRRGARAAIAPVLTGVLAVAVAYFAAWLLRPRGAIIDPVAVSAADWFTSGELDRMLDFRRPQRLIGVALLVTELAALAALAYWAPPRLSRFGRGRPLLAAAAVGAAIALVTALVALPFGLVAADRARDAGLLIQSVPDWLFDRARAEAIALLTAAVAATLAITLIRRLGRHWWLAGTGAVAAYAVLVVWLWPVVVSPVFNEFEPLPDGPAREEILELADRADVEIGELLVTDTGRRSTAINAYVTGLGPTKRVVVSDNALAGLNREELRSVLAHELAHVTANDVPRGVVWVILAAPLAMLFVQLASARLARARGVDPGSPAAIPAIALCLALAVVVLTVPANHLSRQVEARADTFALELTGDPAAMIDLQRRLAVANLTDPDPPVVLHRIFGTHPTKVERIGAALAYSRR